MARTKAFDEAAALESAMNIFWTKGYCSTSLEDLVTGLGISRSSMYDTFSDKRTLFLAALKLYHSRHARAMVEMLSRATTILHVFKQILYSIVEESLVSPMPKGCFMVNSAIEIAQTDEEITSFIAHNNAVVEEAFKKAIKRGQKNGELSQKLSAEALAQFVFNTITGMRVLAKSRPKREQLENICTVVLSCLEKTVE